MPESRLQANVPSDHDGSSPDERQDLTTIPEDDAQSVIGVSISRAQTRFMSLQTPAAEKAAAMASIQGGGLFDGTAEENAEGQEDADSRDSESKVLQHSCVDRQALPDPEHSASLPSPWRVSSNPFEKAKRPDQDHLIGPTNMLADLNVKRYITSFNLPNLPSMPKTPSFKDFSVPSLSTILSSTRARSPLQKNPTRQKRATTTTFADVKPGWSTGRQDERYRNQDLVRGGGHTPERSGVENGLTAQRSTAEVQNASFADDEGHRRITSSASVRDTAGPLPLRRATSNQSLFLRRVTSAGSSLGDDSRWENVQDQVNSRTKAIMDSLQDSSIKLPSMPNIPSFNLSSFRPEFTRSRAHSEIKRPTQIANVDRDLDDRLIATRRQGEASMRADDTQIVRLPNSTPSYMGSTLEHLTGDIVVMGGYRGSILRSAQPPNRQLWVPVKVGLNIRRVNLEVGLRPEDEENMEESIFASGMLSHIGPVDMGRRLLKRLLACNNAQEGRLRVHDYGYDWRLSPHLLSRRLIEFLERLPSNREGMSEQRGTTIIAHSMGGLITRHAVNQRPELFAGVVFAGVPQNCVNILGPLRNGDEVLLSSRVLTAQVNFTLRSSYLLLPEDGKCFVNRDTKEEYPVNFFDVEAWKKYAFSPCIAPTLPPAHLPENKGILGSVSGMLPSLPGRKVSSSNPNDDRMINPATANALDPQLSVPSSFLNNGNSPQRSTIPLPDALAYLTRTLAQTLTFKSEMAHKPSHTAHNTYPPFAVLYANNTPTVVAARVSSRDAIRRADAYDDLQFASGDGVCLARAAMLPEGYVCVKGGRVRTERGHVGLLGDLEGVGRCLAAVVEGRRRGIGLGLDVGDEPAGR
ncbi:hypothetical protein MMC28_006510 [Mycoblastus sanguinarius]|nr:hypothetical protein [Mycoblastus sanguinarius]